MSGSQTAFQARQAASSAAQAELRYKQDQAIAAQISDPELRAQVLQDAQANYSRVLNTSNQQLTSSNSSVPAVTSQPAQIDYVDLQRARRGDILLEPGEVPTIQPPSSSPPSLPRTLDDTIQDTYRAAREPQAFDITERVNQQLGEPQTPPPITQQSFPVSGQSGPPSGNNSSLENSTDRVRAPRADTIDGSASQAAPPMEQVPDGSASRIITSLPLTLDPRPTGTASANNSPPPIRQNPVVPLFNFEPNQFNTYDRVTYSFKLFMVNDLDAKDPDIASKILNNQIRTIVIAQSGVTVGFNITEVSITDSLSANFRSRSNLTTDINIKLTEPYAMTLPDRLYAGSKVLGIRNWRLAPMFLQLEFKYINEDGTIYVPQSSQQLIKLYSLLIVDFDSQLKETGAEYDLKCSSQNNLGFRDFFQILPNSQTIKLSTANTVEEFFRELGTTITELNRKARKNASSKSVPPSLVEYNFTVRDSLLAQQTIDYSPQKSQRKTSFQGGQGGEVTVARGVGISALVDDILSSLTDPKFFIANQQAGTYKIPIIECITEIIGWDNILNEYVRRFNYVIGMKESARPVPFKEVAEQFQGKQAQQMQRLQTLSQNMKKSYEYFYTGKNTEIISLDVKFNQLHVIVQPLMEFLPNVQFGGDTSKVDPRIQALKDKQQAEQKIKETANLDPSQVGSEYRKQVEQDIVRSEQILDRINNESIIPFDLTSGLAGFVTESLNPEQIVALVQQRQQLLDIRTKINEQKNNNQYAEDIPRQLQALELSFAPDPRDMQNTQVRSVAGTSQAEDSSQSTRPIVSSILTQIYDRPGSNMLEIDMEIRGDPYWLGVTDVERARNLINIIKNNQGTNATTASPNTGNSSTSSSSSTSSTNFVQVFDADSTILLRFRAGAQPDSNTGFQKLDLESDFFYGIYTVIQVEHDFRDGKFTQKLKGVRDTLIDLSTLRTAGVENTNPTQPQTAGRPSTFPAPSANKIITATNTTTVRARTVGNSGIVAGPV